MYQSAGNDGSLKLRILDRCVLVAQSRNNLLASIGFDLDRKMLSGLIIDPAQANEEIGARLISKIEKSAVQFGLFDLRIIAAPRFVGLLRSCGYREEPEQKKNLLKGPANTGLMMRRSFPRRRTPYSRRIAQILSQLGITQDYGRIHRLPLQQETSHLKTIGPDIYQREQKMMPQAARAWLSMSSTAEKQGIQIQPVSAFRSVSYQLGLLRRKTDKGLSMKEILHVSAAPGFSEHHTGRAIDITTPGFPVLEEDFESSPAFDWLQGNAVNFGFHLSFPRGNRNKVAYEPWHWAWRPNSNFS